MKTLSYLVVLFLTIGLQYSCDDKSDSPKVQEEPIAYEALLDVSYGSDAHQVYDIYLPENRTSATKIMIVVHGGGWNAGDKSDINNFKDFIREKHPDLAVVNMNYRLADENNPPYPMQTDDITAVVNDLKAKQTEYQIGTDLGFFGISAGGHLSLLWSYVFDVENKVKMVCSFTGPTDLTAPEYLNSENLVLRDLILQFGEEIEVLENVSPLFKVTSTSPPTLLFYGGADPLIPTSQGVELDAKLTELNVVHEFTLYPNEGHGWVGDNLLDTSLKLEAFINNYLLN